MKKNLLNFYIHKSNSYRHRILDLIYNAKKGHIGGSYSIIDLLSYLYLSGKLDHLKKKKINPYTDNICLLSKGHCAIAQYVILEDLNFIKKKDLSNFNSDGSKYGEHPDLHINGIQVNSGSLGHTLSYSLGIAYDRYIKKNKNKIYIVLGDGELSEGSNWESFLFLKEHSYLTNLVIIIDNNKFMTLKSTNNSINANLIENFFKDNMDINFYSINGHDFNGLHKCFSKIKVSKNSSVVFLNTIKGKGIKFMENNKIWHHKVPNKEEYINGKKILESVFDD